MASSSNIEKWIRETTPKCKDSMILNSLKGADGSIHFQAFLNAMKWAQSSHLNDKIKGVFNLINSGKPITQDIFEKLLKRVYPDDSEEAIKRTAKVFFEQMDSNNKGHVTEDDFVLWIRKMPDETLSAILDFHVVPPAIDDEVKRLFNERDLGEDDDPLRPDSELSLAQQIPNDALLLQVAEQAHTRDWNILVKKLHLSPDEITSIERQNQDDKVSQVFAMLQVWRDNHGAGAKASVLEKALRDSNMNDIALLLYP